jgi:magnesium-protoporphyrin O-methyltransferase
MAKPCCQCDAMARFFNAREAARELRRYRKSGPARTTRLLVEALETQEVEGSTLLDIGGGIGAIQLALLAAGAASATDVDASRAYLDAAKAEAEREGYAGRVTYVDGNFVELADALSQADIVTLERVICCFPDMPALIGASAAKAQRLYGLVYPRDVWWMRLGRRVINAAMWLQRSAFRFYVHSQAAVELELRRAGLVSRYATTAGPWQVALYARPVDASGQTGD